MATVSIRELTRNAPRVVEQVRSTRRPAFVTKRGAPVAVVLPLDQDELEDFVLANAPEFVATMKSAEREIARGKRGRPLGEVIAGFESEHGPLDAES